VGYGVRVEAELAVHQFAKLSVVVLVDGAVEQEFRETLWGVRLRFGQLGFDRGLHQLDALFAPEEV